MAAAAMKLQRPAGDNRKWADPEVHVKAGASHQEHLSGCGRSDGANSPPLVDVSEHIAYGGGCGGWVGAVTCSCRMVDVSGACRALYVSPPRDFRRNRPTRTLSTGLPIGFARLASPSARWRTCAARLPPSSSAAHAPWLTSFRGSIGHFRGSIVNFKSSIGHFNVRSRSAQTHQKRTDLLLSQAFTAVLALLYALYARCGGTAAL